MAWMDGARDLTAHMGKCRNDRVTGRIGFCIFSFVMLFGLCDMWCCTGANVMHLQPFVATTLSRQVSECLLKQPNESIQSAVWSKPKDGFEQRLLGRGHYCPGPRTGLGWPAQCRAPTGFFAWKNAWPHVSCPTVVERLTAGQLQEISIDTARWSVQTCGIGRQDGPADQSKRDTTLLQAGFFAQFACKNGVPSHRQRGIVWAHCLAPHSHMPRQRTGPAYCLATGKQVCNRWTGTSTPKTGSDSLAGRLRDVHFRWCTTWLYRLNHRWPPQPTDSTGRGRTGWAVLQMSHSFQCPTLEGTKDQHVPHHSKWWCTTPYELAPTSGQAGALKTWNRQQDLRARLDRCQCPRASHHPGLLPSLPTPLRSGTSGQDQKDGRTGQEGRTPLGTPDRRRNWTTPQSPQARLEGSLGQTKQGLAPDPLEVETTGKAQLQMQATPHSALQQQHKAKEKGLGEPAQACADTGNGART
eukprot:16624-Amphidinium_carterae.2